VLRHRLILTYDALAEGVTTDDVIRRVLSTVPAPQVSPRQDEAQSGVEPSGATWLQGIA
jgi:MoxR-like ATPase